MKNALDVRYAWETLRGEISPASILLILVLVVAFPLGVMLSLFNPVYSIVAAGILFIGIVILLRWDVFMVVLIVAVHIIVDWYLAFRLVSVLMGLVLLVVCYFGRSTEHPWVKPRFVWLWVAFLLLTIYPAIKGGSFDLYDADTYYPSIVFSAFMMFWLGNIVAKDVSAIRSVFQFLSLLATLIAIHTIIEATTGKFLLESARAQAALAQNSYQLVQNLGVQISRAGSFLGHPNENGDFLAFSFFLPLGLFVASKRVVAKISYLLAMLLILLALAFTYSSGAWIALFVGILIFVIFAGHIRYSLLLLVLIGVLTVMAFTVFSSQLALQLSHINANNESSLHLGAWQTALRVTEAYPLFGVGMGNQVYTISEEPFRVPAQIVPLFEPDNSYLQWSAEAGIPVLLIFLLLLGQAFRFSLRSWLAIDTRYRPLIGGGVAALTALCIDSLSNNGWTDPSGMVSLGWLVAGVMVAPFIGSISSLPREGESSILFGSFG